MIALALLVASIVWGVLGIWLSRTLARRMAGTIVARLALIVVLSAIWVVAPMTDELLGSKKFNEMCSVHQRLEFFGPVSIGSGVLFDENGRPKWSSDRQLQEMPIAQWNAFFVTSMEQVTLAEYPIPIVDQVTERRSAKTGQLVAVAHYISSPGGWFRRFTGWSKHAPYQCETPVKYPPREKWIKF